MKPRSKSPARVLLTSACVFAASLIAAPAASLQQQGGDFILHPTVFTSGGGASTSCTMRIEGSIGQTGLGTSSGPEFTVEPGYWPNTPTCPLALTPSTQFFTTAGGSGSINVSAAASCGWTALVKTDWITITSSDTGIGNDVVTFEVRENFTGSPRQASLNVGGFTQLVVQDAGLADDCSYSINPQFQSFPGNGGSGTVNVTAEERCAWQAFATAGWITITSTNLGVGNATISYCVAANPGTSGRSSSMIIGGKTFSVKQKGN